jgi:hypothetical protein
VTWSPAPGAANRFGGRRTWVAALLILLVAGAGAGLWAFQTHRARQQEAALARSAEIATARARVVAAARARGIAVTAKAVAATQAAEKSTAAALPKSARVADASQASAIFTTHSWYVAPPPPAYVPPPPPPPPPPPTAPPLPYVFLGSYTPSGDATVFFLTRGDRVYDIKVGDTVDGLYVVESAKGGQLSFLYKPLNQHQTLAIGATP